MVSITRGLCVTRLSGGHERSVELRTFPAPNKDQDNASNQRETAENWWNGNVLLLFRGSVDGPKVDNLFLMGVIETLIGKSQPAENS
jgi:hypothetical protein